MAGDYPRLVRSVSLAKCPLGATRAGLGCVKDAGHHGACTNHDVEAEQLFVVNMRARIAPMTRAELLATREYYRLAISVVNDELRMR